ncbi:MAG: S-layer homology domain-containing protein [Oscillospiraceae bacterium]|nr:S-layer homology domain-containing protein [Oscillospiraceae bacterium]
MKKLITLALFVLGAIALSTATAYAAPASPRSFSIKQPDGTIIAVKLQGDEFLNWTEDSNGNLIVFDEVVKAYCYADWADEQPASTGILVDDTSMLNSAVFKPKIQKIPQEALDAAIERRESRHPTSKNGLPQGRASRSSNIPNVADISELWRKILVIYVRWADESNIDRAPLSGQQIYDIIFNPQTRSVNTYYRELLNQTDDVVIPAQVTNPLGGIQGIIEVRLPGTHTNPGGDFEVASDIVTAAYDAADPYVNFAEFDTNDDGVITSNELTVCIITQGYEASYDGSTPSVWGSAGYTGGIRDGVYTPSSFIQGAYHGDHLLTVGILCHEFGHSGYNFSDTYDYGGIDGGSAGMGYWSLMARGSWGYKNNEYLGESPSYADAYNLVANNLVSPGIISGQADSITSILPTDIYKVLNPYNDTQYFLTQLRKYGNDDNFDRGTFGQISWGNGDESMGGLLIYHIDETVWTMNDKNTHYRAGIEEAHGETQHLPLGSEEGGIGDLWGTDYTLFSHLTDPSSGLYSPFTYDYVPPNQDQESGVTIYGIKWNSALQSATFGVREGSTYIDEFPDPSFRSVVLNLIGGERNDETRITPNDRAFFSSFTYLDIADKNITDLKGIEFFTGLNQLYCQSNRLSKLDVSKNTALSVLDCSDNRLRSLNVSARALTSLNCAENFITSPNSVLGRKNVANFTFFPQKSYALMTYAEAFPANVFRRRAIDIIGSERSDGDVISSSDIAVWASYSGDLNLSFSGISDLSGIEFFTGINSLWCIGNGLKLLDVSKNTALVNLGCYINQLTELDVTNNTDLVMLSCSSNQLTELDVSHNTKLSGQLLELSIWNSYNTNFISTMWATGLDVSGNQLTTLDVSNNTALEVLACGGNRLETLNMSDTTKLKALYCEWNQLNALDMSDSTVLEVLICYNNQLTALDISNSTPLRAVQCSTNLLGTLDVTNNIALEALICYDNCLTELDVSKNERLGYLNCESNYMTSIDSVVGWQSNPELVLYESFHFYPQNDIVPKINQTIPVVVTLSKDTAIFGVTETALYAQASGGEGEGEYIYASSDNKVAEIGKDGTITLVGVGETEITAFRNGDQEYNDSEPSSPVTLSVLPKVELTATNTAAAGDYLVNAKNQGKVSFSSVNRIPETNNFTLTITGTACLESYVNVDGTQDEGYWVGALIANPEITDITKLWIKTYSNTIYNQLTPDDVVEATSFGGTGSFVYWFKVTDSGDGSNHDIFVATGADGDNESLLTISFVPYMGDSNDEQIVADDKEALTWDVIKGANTAQTSVTSNLSLPTSGANGSTIAWASSDTTTVSETGVVTSPPYSSGNKTVTLTATISSGRQSDTVVFTITVNASSSSSPGTPSPSTELPPPVTIPDDSQPPLAEDWDNPYSDVFDADWFYEAVRFVTEEKLMTGTSANEFSPNVIMSRAMIVTVLYRMEGKSETDDTYTDFADVAPGSWYETAVGWAAKNEIVLGFPGGVFRPNDPITREEAVTILYRYAQYKGIDISAADDLSKFTDMGDISAWALDAMRWAIAVGIVQGRTATTTVPQGTSTRAEVATILKRYIEDFLDRGGSKGE